jgi:hypothetical protein
MKNKAKLIEKKINELPKQEQQVLREYFEQDPKRVFGVQKSLLKGFSDLPLFGESQKQQELF